MWSFSLESLFTKLVAVDFCVHVYYNENIYIAYILGFFSNNGLFPSSLPSAFWDFSAHGYIYMPFGPFSKEHAKIATYLVQPGNASRVPKSSNIEVQA